MPVILHFEDEDAYAARCQATLEHLGWTYVRRPNPGLDAIEDVLAVRPRVILSDITMPVMNGLRLLRVLKADLRTRGIPVVLLTNISGESARQQGLALGAARYCVKWEQGLEDALHHLASIFPAAPGV